MKNDEHKKNGNVLSVCLPHSPLCTAVWGWVYEGMEENSQHGYKDDAGVQKSKLSLQTE